MKALSLSQPWCWSIFDPIADKGIENRSWAPPIAMIGETFAIHAAKSWVAKPEYTCAAHGVKCPVYGLELLSPFGYFIHLGIDAPSRKETYDVSAITGVATLDRVVTDASTLRSLNLEHQVRWLFGPYGWVLTNRRKLKRPIPCGGKQGLWTVPEPISREIEIQLGEVN